MACRKLFSAGLAVAGMLAISYLLGAAAMFFQLPSSGALGKAFLGGLNWYSERQPPVTVGEAPTPAGRPAIDYAEKTFDGFTLFARGPNGQDLGTQAFLLNMRGEVVHRWAIPFSRIFPDQSHLRSRQSDTLVCFFECRLFPNGDLLAVLHGRTAPAGCGLVRLDKNSRVLWTYPGCVHHDIDVAGDGTIYALEENIESDMPKGFETISNSRLVDKIVVLSSEGKPLGEPISILAAFRNSPFADYLATLEKPPAKHMPPAGSTVPDVDYDLFPGDPLHPNSVRVLANKLAARFPTFKAGHLLVSLRNLSIIAVLDPQRQTVVWATRGPWYVQHDAQFLDNGHLLIFDNLGSPVGSRVLEYDPRTLGFPWSYSGEGGTPFFTSERGMSQRLPNGNTMIVSSEGGDLLEVTAEKEVVWTCNLGGYVTTARRYSPEQLSFFQGDARGQP